MENRQLHVSSPNITRTVRGLLRTEWDFLGLGIRKIRQTQSSSKDKEEGMNNEQKNGDNRTVKIGAVVSTVIKESDGSGFSFRKFIANLINVSTA